MTTKIEHDLEALFEAQTSELGVGDPPALHDIALAPTDNHNSRRRPLLAAAALLIVAGIAGIGLATRISEPTAPSDTTTAAVPTERGMLVPVGLEHGEPPEVNVVEPDRRSAAGLVLSTAGTPYRISVGVQAAPANPDAKQRQIGTHLVSVDSDSAFSAYTVSSECVAVNVTEPSNPEGGAASEIDELIERLVIADAGVSLTLPDGWQSFGAGTPGRLVQITYEYRFDDDAHTVTLAQAIDTPIAALQGLTLAPLVPARLNGQPAWTFEWPQTDLRSLVWNDNGNAVMAHHRSPARPTHAARSSRSPTRSDL